MATRKRRKKSYGARITMQIDKARAMVEQYVALTQVKAERGDIESRDAKRLLVTAIKIELKLKAASELSRELY